MAMRSERSFTLIELLVVVAIISILASIALPNYQHAMVKARSAAALAEMNSLSTAIEAYSLDFNTYPLDGNDYMEIHEDLFDQRRIQKVLTTPTAYISEIPKDIFHKDEKSHIYDPAVARYFQSKPPFPYLYQSRDNFQVHHGSPKGYYLFSFGPDLEFNNESQQADNFIIYDMTNGVISGGDILRKGP